MDAFTLPAAHSLVSCTNTRVCARGTRIHAARATAPRVNREPLCIKKPKKQ